MNIKKNQLEDIIDHLPNIENILFNDNFLNEEYDLFLSVLGFEDRVFAIPEFLSKIANFKCNESIYFVYKTNKIDNEKNKKKFLQYLNCYSKIIGPHISIDSNLNNYIENKIKNIINKIPKVILDISVLSSRYLISLIKILFQYEIELIILYSEAKIYHPTLEEYELNKEEFKVSDSDSFSKGVGDISVNQFFPGSDKEKPDLIIAFPTFKPERTDAIITRIDETITDKSNKRLIWIIGEPNMPQDIKIKRKEMMIEINEIPPKSKMYELCTLDYKKTMNLLNSIYQVKYKENHINISGLGSKMQSLGIALFCMIYPNISVYHAIPKEYSPASYSEGIKQLWKINFGNTRDLLKLLYDVDTYKLIR